MTERFAITGFAICSNDLPGSTVRTATLTVKHLPEEGRPEYTIEPFVVSLTEAEVLRFKEKLYTAPRVVLTLYEVWGISQLKTEDGTIMVIPQTKIVKKIVKS